MEPTDTIDPRRRSPTALTLLRVVLGAVLAAHGALKLQDAGAFVDTLRRLGLPFPEVMAGCAIATELGGGILLILGLLTPLAAFAVTVTMAVAVFGVHLDQGPFAVDGGYEYPAVLASVALLFLFQGAGPYSLDALIHRRLVRRLRRRSSDRRGGRAPA